LKEAFIFYEDCLSIFTEIEGDIKHDTNLLDFGVGWGRIARFFLKEFSRNNIYGLDVMDEFVKICNETFDSHNFIHTNAFPPSSFESNKFSYIVGYSVFSHLSEDACNAWMKEFYRITRPGGLIALTTRGRPFFDYCESLKGTKIEGYSKSLSLMFQNFDEARKLYDEGNFVHSNAPGVNGGGAMTADFYGETFIPEKYARNAYSDYFQFEQFLFNPKRQSHPIMFFRRK
jgi:SAM-dependent methyltransferase